MALLKRNSGFSKRCVPNMVIANIVYSLFAPAIIWLLYGLPDLFLTGNLGLFLVVILHLYAFLWIGFLFAWFHGDTFTYGMVALTINGLSFATTFILCWIVLIRFDRKVEALSSISPFIWGVIGIGLLVTISIPMVTSRHVSPLPKVSERREFENPCDSNH